MMNNIQPNNTTMFRQIANYILNLFKSELPKFDILHSEEECPICLELFAQLDTFKDLCTLKCGHSFHKMCVTDWASKDPTCPTCRGDISSHFSH